VSDVEGGVNYGLVKRFFDKYDYVTMPYSATQDYYSVGAAAFLANRAVFDPSKGWTLHGHNQPAAPLFFGPFIPWPSPAPSFQGRRFQLSCTRTALVRFSDIRNVEAVIPPTPPWHRMEFYQKSFILFARSLATAGTMSIWVEG
jgi:hypothetical protein